MPSDKNAHQSLRGSPLPRVVTHSSGLALLGAICEMARLRHSCCRTSYMAICTLCPFVYLLHSMGSVESCRRHTRSKEEWGQAGACKGCWKLDKIMGCRTRTKGWSVRLGNAWLHPALYGFVSGYYHPRLCVGD